MVDLKQRIIFKRGPHTLVRDRSTMDQTVEPEERQNEMLNEMLNQQGPRPNLDQAIVEEVQRQDAARGDWPSPRKAEMPNPPYPDPDSAVMEFLVHQAMGKIAEGEDIFSAVTYLAAHSWFEGGIEGYDRGRADAVRGE